MDRAEKLKMLNDLFTAHDDINLHIGALKATLNPDPGCAFYESVFKLLDVAVNATASALGDNSEWLVWMIYENECGRRGHEAGYDGQIKPIRTVEDLLDLIEEGNNGR